MGLPESAPGYEIRPFRTLDDYRDCVVLQEETWGTAFSERVSVAILKVSQRIGGVSSGAYDDSGRLVGFVFGMTGWVDGAPVHWSDMLAVRPELRNAGIGRALKWHQRRVLLDRGVKTMRWTFDPLESRNAHLNLNRLGAVVREYAPNMYGDTDSPLHRGIGTDRFVPLWELDSARVLACWERARARRSGGAGPGPAATAGPWPADATVVLDHAARAGVPTPGRPVLDDTAAVVSVSFPSDIQAVKSASLEAAVAWREATRAALMHYLERGYEVRELVRGEPCSRYLMFRP